MSFEYVEYCVFI